ncbi:MAG: 4-hydroxybutyryl-CoA dehydratase / vinylacetyl-CoA-Delta-isomerase [Mycobacterium sp.]|nr:4-hydroxybutyryl-CoA dehydratase / vinylacetyl-CoA-Delta-isomerase [Mycobacterium sp.]
MGLRNADQFRAGSIDGSSVFYRGLHVKPVVAEPELALSVDHSALCFTIAVDAERRLRILNFIADLTARDYGGYQMVLATHAEGSLEAEKLQIARSFDPTRAVDYVSTLAGLETVGPTNRASS